MIELTTLGNITCYSIILAMAVVIFKAFSYPLSNFFRAINPFVHYRLWQGVSSRVDDINMDVFTLKQEIKDLKSELNKLKNNKTKTSKK
jgi:uncharacterized protein YlxW (UPF0749 family)